MKCLQRFAEYTYIYTTLSHIQMTTKYLGHYQNCTSCLVKLSRKLFHQSQTIRAQATRETSQFISPNKKSVHL